MEWLTNKAADSINTTIQIGNENIPSSSSVRNIRFFYNSLLKNTTHINRLTLTLTCTLKKIRIIQNKLTTGAIKVLIQVPVFSKLDYCNSLLSGTPSYNLQKLQ